MKTILFKHSLLLFTIFSLHIRGMKKEENFKRKADIQLVSIIKKIPITHQRHYGDMIKYPNVTSYFVCINKVSHNGNKPYLNEYGSIRPYELQFTNNFDTRPIEDMVLKHMRKKLQKNLYPIKL